MIETRRLVLRVFEPDDLEPYLAIRSRPSNARFLPGGEAGVTDPAIRARAIVNPWGRQVWAAGGYAPWAVVEKSSLRLIGHLGLRYLRDIKETELLYLIDEPWWGQGLATEGGHAAVTFARKQLRVSRLVAFVVPENAASVAVIRKLRFRCDGTQSIFGLNACRFVLALAPMT